MLAKDTKYPIPLKSINLNVNVTQQVASFMMTQEYVNVEDCLIETIFLFPLDIESVVSKLTCEFTLPDGSKRQLETLIESKERAEVIYEDKVASG